MPSCGLLQQMATSFRWDLTSQGEICTFAWVPLSKTQIAAVWLHFSHVCFNTKIILTTWISLHVHFQCRVATTVCSGFFSEIIETQIFTPSQVNHDIHCTFGGIQDFHLRKWCGSSLIDVRFRQARTKSVYIYFALFYAHYHFQGSTTTSTLRCVHNFWLFQSIQLIGLIAQRFIITWLTPQFITIFTYAPAGATALGTCACTHQ